MTKGNWTPIINAVLHFLVECFTQRDKSSGLGPECTLV